MTEIDRLKEVLANREKELKDMSMQLAQYVQTLYRNEEELTKLREQSTVLKRKLKRREAQIDQERRDKDLLMGKAQSLEKLVERSAQKPSSVQRLFGSFAKKQEDDSVTDAYIEYFSQAARSAPEIANEEARTN
jgi:DNA repair exonuclease SbcCD ATPase subunit